MKNDFDDIKGEDLVEELDFKIEKDAFKGPFICCRVKTKKVKKQMSVQSINFSYEVWQCSKCKKEFVDVEQAKRLEKVWMIEKILDEKLISIERSVNYDGKTFFVRFPVEITKKWHKGVYADIKLLSPEEFFIKVKT